MKLLQLLLLGISAGIIAASAGTTFPPVSHEMVTHKFDVTRGEIGYPFGCVESNCVYKVIWKYMPFVDEIEFTVLSKQLENRTIAVAFTEKLLTESSLIDLIYGFVNQTDMKETIVDAWISNRNSLIEIDTEQDVLSPMDVKYVNGWMNMTFIRPRKLTDPKDLSFEGKCYYFVLVIDGIDFEVSKKLSDKVVLSPQKICIGPLVGVTGFTEPLLTMKTGKTPLGINEKLSTMLPKMHTTESYEFDDQNVQTTGMWMIPKNCRQNNSEEWCNYFMYFTCNQTTNVTTIHIAGKLKDGHWTGLGYTNSNKPTKPIFMIVGAMKTDGTGEVFNGWAASINDAPVKSGENDLLSGFIWCQEGFIFMNATFKRDILNTTCPYLVIPESGGIVKPDNTLEKSIRPMYVTEGEVCCNPEEIYIGNNTGKQVIGFYDIKTKNLTGKGQCLPEDIDPKLLTIVIVNSANMSSDNMLMPNHPEDTEQYKKINDLKNENLELKTYLSITVGPNFEKMLGNSEATNTFINSSIDLLGEQNFDGLNLRVWHLSTTKKTLFTDFIKKLSLAFDGLSTGEKHLTLLLTVSARVIMENQVELNSIHKNLKFIVVLTERLNRLNNVTSNVTEHHAPLISNLPYSEISLESVMNLAAENVPREQLIATASGFGIGFTLEDPSKHNLGDLIVGPSPAGEFTNRKGLLAYYEFCKLINTTATTFWLTPESVPYMLINDTTWLGYDDKRSVKGKALWVKTNNFGGLALDRMNYDDCKGDICGMGPSPLLKTIHDTLIEGYGVTGTLPPLSKILHSTESLVHNTGKMVTHLPTLHNTNTEKVLIEGNTNTEKLVTHLPILHKTEKVVTGTHIPTEGNTGKLVTQLPILHKTEKVVTHLTTEGKTEKVVTHLTTEGKTEKVVTHLPLLHSTEKVVTKHK